MDLSTKETITWCPGCGNHSILSALKQAIFTLNLKIKDCVIVYGIGCHGHMVNYLAINGFEGLHGRPIPVASGIKIANQKLNVIVVAGDGDTFDEGMQHFIHACRHNISLKLFIHDNRVFGLTTGQTSPTAGIGFKSKSTPNGSISEPVNNLGLALVNHASFIAQELAFDIPSLAKTMAAAIRFPGLAYLNILQQCVTFNKVNSVEWYRNNSQRLDPKKSLNQTEAFDLITNPKKLPLGVIYLKARPTYESQLVVNKKPVEFNQLKTFFQ